MLRLPQVRSGRGSWVATIAIGLAVVILALVSLGLPGTLLLVGGWLLAAAIGRHVPGLDGPVSWAAAVVVETAVISVLSVLLAELSPHEHGSLPSLAVLAAPAVLGVVGLLGGWTAGRGSTSGDAATRARRPGRAGLAATVTTAGLLVPMWVASKGTNYRVAWAASGDGRNHALIAREILRAGGLTPSELRNYPALIDNLTALLSSAGGRRGLLPGQLMLHDLRAMAATYVVCGIALACLFVAALLELLPVATARLRFLPPPLVVATLASAALSTTALVLGTSLLDGYVSSYGTLPLTMAALVLALRCCAEPSPASFALLGPAAVLVFFSWTLLAAAPVAVILVTSAVVLTTQRGALRGWSLRSALPWLVGVAVSGAAVLSLVVGTWTHTTLFHHQFEAPGSVTPPQHRVLYVLAFFSVGLLAAARWPGGRRALLVPLTAVVIGIATVRFLVWLSPDGKTWTYYASKTLALSAATLAWLPFAPLVLALGRPLPAEPRAARRLDVLGASVAAGAAALAALVLVGWSTPLGSPLAKATTGWNQPNADVLTEDARLADAGHPFLLWHLTDGGNDRLGDFWAALAWSYQPDLQPVTYGPNTLGGIEYWAYIETGAIHDLCRVAKDVDGLYVLTSETNLKAQIDKYCPNLGMHVLVRPKP